MKFAQAMEMHGPLDPLRERFIYEEARVLFARSDAGELLGTPRFQFDDAGRARPIVTKSIAWTLEQSTGPIAKWASLEWWELSADKARRPLTYLLA